MGFGRTKPYLYLFFFTLVLFSCKKRCCDPGNPDCSNYNPCHNIYEISAEFEIGQIYNANLSTDIDPYKVFVVDSVFPKVCSLKFRAKTLGAKYKWILGSEIIEEREFSRVFSEEPGKISVTLIIEKEPNKSCHPNDDGKDTLTKVFNLVEFCDLASVGVYRGVVDNSIDSITWKLMFVDVIPSTWPPKYTGFCGKSQLIITGPINSNLHTIIKDTIYSNFNAGYLITNRKVFLGTETSGGDAIGIGKCKFEISKDNSVEFSYFNNNLFHHFKGRKVD